MTDRCIKDNSIDVDPHVQMKTTGKLYQVTQDIENRINICYLEKKQ